MTLGTRLPKLVLALLLVTGLFTVATSAPGNAAQKQTAQKQTGQQQATKNLTLTALSSRADLVTGGTAVLGLNLASTDGLTVTVNGVDETDRFKTRADGSVEGLVNQLRIGTNDVVAQVGDRGARLTLTNHPNGGPLFSGPQLQPWGCQAGARDAKCDQSPSYSYYYMSTSALKKLKNAVSTDPNFNPFQPYDPANPATDVAKTTTDQGVTVPFIVRVETGYQDRDQFKVATLFQPGKHWWRFQQQPQWDHKLLITHGASCGTDRKTGGAPDVLVGASMFPWSAATTALGRGYMTMSTALDNSGHNCNVAVQAESLEMAKEYIAKTYGAIRFTIGTGCSGGSLAQQWVANAYPGIYQGILPTCSFPDAWSVATQFMDYHFLLAYFDSPSKWGKGILWGPTQMAAVEGSDLPTNAIVSEEAQFHVAVPTDDCSGITDAQRYDPKTNPGGVRCDIQDAAINLFGPRVKSSWSANEKLIGHGFAGVPVDNVGVQYGLAALEKGKISPAQFVDVNEKAGGVDIDMNAVPERRVADRPALARAYRTGMINEANNLDRTAIIDCRGPDPTFFHDSYRAFAVRARLDRAHGSHANQAIWEGATPIIGDVRCELNSFTTMDHWLTNVESDHAVGTVAQKIVRDRPADAVDQCYTGVGLKLKKGLCGQAIVPVYGTPRTVAGDSIATDTNKCQLTPLDRSSYVHTNVLHRPVTFTDAQWARLQKIFPDGVCDFSKPGVDQRTTVPWQTYQNADGSVIYGGKGLPTAPKSTPFTP